MGATTSFRPHVSNTPLYHRPCRSNGHRALPATLAAQERYSRPHCDNRPITHRRLLRLLFPSPRTRSDSGYHGDFAGRTTSPDVTLIRATFLAFADYRTRLGSIGLDPGCTP